jgi:threonine dehydratase
MGSTLMISLEEIREAQHRLRGVATRTPLLPCPYGDPERPLYFKPESLQPVGSFKVRGAYNKIASTSPEQREHGVVAHSSGNHVQAVAYAARALRVRAVIVMPRGAPALKRERTASLGAEVVEVGEDSEERRLKAEELAAQEGLLPVPPYDDELVMAGQGTIGLEILQDLPEVGTVLVPVSGGGLISGVAVALKRSNPEVRVVGVEPELAADAQASLERDRLIAFPAEEAGKTIADALRVRRLGDLTWSHVREFVDDIVTVSEGEIREAMRKLAIEARLVAEPGGAVSFAAWLFRQEQLPPTRLNVALISGGNVDPSLLAQVLSESVSREAE